jgi:SLOG cluster2
MARASRIAEEVMLTCALGKPVYVLGGRGGGAKEVGRLLGLDQTVANPDDCLADDEIERQSGSALQSNAFTLPGHPNLPQTTAEVRTFLFKHGIMTTAWPRNGLTLQENRELFGASIRTGADDSRKKCVDLIVAGLLRLNWPLAARPPLE